MSENDSLPLISGSDCSPVPVFNCQIILHRNETAGQIVGRVANLGGITAKGSTERDVLMQITKVFRLQVQTLTQEKTPIPWIDPPEQPGPGEVERFVPIHL
jgi:predicted RNase H-like HicB family nuclease